jgi:hypothetical protein
MPIAANVARVCERIAAAARRCGRSEQEVTLMAVSKTFTAAAIREAYDAGLRVFGENRVQEFAAKAAGVRDLNIDWHMIGHLQANKSSKAVELFAAVDSVDSLRLARRLNSAAGTLGRKLVVLIEINLGGESEKSGLAPDSPELEEIVLAAPQLEHLQLRGLMAIPPLTDNPEGARPYFRRLRQLQQAIARRRIPQIELAVLSMGMSHDFDVAIEEGSTCIRVGTAIFGERPKAES